MKKVYLTGASSGIGLAIARALTAAGCEVWGTSRSLERLPKDLPRFHPTVLRLNDEATVRASFAHALAESGGRFDVLINNAGVGWFGPASEMPAEAFRSQFEKLTFAPFFLMQMALPAMREQPGGLVINVTSLAGRLPLPYSAAYSAAKAALSVLTATLRMEEPEMGEHPVTFVDVQPGDINTEFNRSMKLWKGVDAEDAVAGTAARKVLAGSDQSMASAPPPETVGAAICRIVLQGRSAPVVTVGNFWQAALGPLAVRFLPPRLLQWTIRRNFGLK